MKILIATDAWHPQVNGVVAHLGMWRARRRHSAPKSNSSAPINSALCRCRAIRKSGWRWPAARSVARRLERSGRTRSMSRPKVRSDMPCGGSACGASLPFTTSFHTRFPDYLAERLPVPERWTARRHGPGCAVSMRRAPRHGGNADACLRTHTRGFKNVKLWPRGVDADCFARARRPGSIFRGRYF